MLHHDAPNLSEASPASVAHAPAEPPRLVHPEPAAKPQALRLDERGMIVAQDSAEELRYAKALIDAGIPHPSLRTPVQVMMAVQLARSLKLNPLTALRQIAVRNNVLCVFGDLELAVVRMSGKLEDIKEFLFVETKDGKYQERSFANANADVEVLGAVCQVKRDGMAHEEMFTVTDAKRAKLWGKPGPWTAFSSRMLQMRARGLCIRNVFSDVTQGLDTVEYGHEGVERS